jgi:hypothetical protein
VPNSMAASDSSDPLPPTARRPYLVVVAGFGVGRAFPVRERTQIGRDPDGEVVLPYWTVSWRHLTVSYRDGIVVAEDLGSRNGTFVGLKKVKLRKLVEGDVLAVGDSVLLKLVFAAAPENGDSTHSYLLPQEPLTGVETAAFLLERLRKEHPGAPTDGAPLSLVWYRVDGLDEHEELPLVERAMRVVALAILEATKGEILLARSADGEFVGMARAPTKKLCKMANGACGSVRRQVAKGLCPTPLLLVAAVVPLSGTAPADAELTLKMARERAYRAMVDISTGAVTTLPLGADEGE